jgi:4-hydroxybenzoate polyprenyltransferase
MNREIDRKIDGEKERERQRVIPTIDDKYSPLLLLFFLVFIRCRYIGIR